MKMEVLSVQNHHIQKQFGVIGSTKVKKGKLFDIIHGSDRQVFIETSPFEFSFRAGTKIAFSYVFLRYFKKLLRI